MSIEIKIQEAVIKAIHELYGQVIDSSQVQVQNTRKDLEGDLTIVVFPFLRISKKSPEATAP